MITVGRKQGLTAMNTTRHPCYGSLISVISSGCAVLRCAVLMTKIPPRNPKISLAWGKRGKRHHAGKQHANFGLL